MFFAVVAGVTLIPVIILTAVHGTALQMYYLQRTWCDVFLAIVQIFFAYAATSLTDFTDRKYKDFTSAMLGIGLLFPLVYAVLSCLIKSIVPNDVKWIAGVRKYVLCFFLPQYNWD